LHSHDFTEIAIIVDGTAAHLVKGKESEKVSAGSVIIVPPDVEHGYMNGESLVVFNLLCRPEQLFSPILLNEFCETFPNASAENVSSAPVLHLSANSLLCLSEAFAALEIEMLKNRQNNLFSVCAKFHELIRMLINEAQNIEDELNGSYPFAAVISYMNRCYGQNVNIDQLCGMVNMSRRNFFRRFKQCIGTTPVEYLIGIRLRNAETLLINTDMSMSDIAFECGFCDSNFFSKQFRRHHKISPTEYRRLNKHRII
jgi:AraC family L-rhamnose operon transcriptional activator RhaR/AraC family L-rhamnose operon regulatory protein RhaS